MHDVLIELKQLRLHGMVGAWADLVEQGTSTSLDGARWLVEHLVQAEATDRAMRSVTHQMFTAKFPVHRDLAGFDFEASPVDRKLVMQLADMTFTDDAHNAVLVGGTGTGKTHLATAIGVAGITRHGKRVRFYSTVDLVNALEQEKSQGKAGRIATSLLRMDLVILDELGYLPFSHSGGALLFRKLPRQVDFSKVEPRPRSLSRGNVLPTIGNRVNLAVSTRFCFLRIEGLVGCSPRPPGGRPGRSARALPPRAVSVGCLGCRPAGGRSHRAMSQARVFAL